MYDVFVVYQDKNANFHDVVNMSFSVSRVMLVFKDGSMIRLRPADLSEMKILSNHRKEV